MSHFGIPHDTHLVDPNTGLAVKAWHYFLERVGRLIAEAGAVTQITTADVEASSITVDPIVTIDAIDPATTMALVNECKAKINEIITALETPTDAETAQAALTNELKASFNSITQALSGEH